MKNIFVKPISNFEGAKFEGSASFRSANEKQIFLDFDGEEMKIRRDIWDRAYEQGSYIKLGLKCRVYDEIPTEVVFTKHAKPEFNASNVVTTFLNSMDVDANLYRPIKTGTHIDQFWSKKGGIMPGTVTMVTGDPGIGKSSVLMDILQGVKRADSSKKVLYIMAEMTRVDMLDPDEFLKYYPDLGDKVEFLFASDYIENENGITFAKAIETVLSRGYDVVVMDSWIEIQSILQEELDLGSGKKAEKFLLNLMQAHTEGKNERKIYTAFLGIQQVKKDGEFVGSRRLEHMITALLRLKWDSDQPGKKYLEFRKNRRGPVKIRLYFKLGKGIEYEIEKLNEEIAVQQIMNETKTDEFDQQMTALELAALLQGKKDNIVNGDDDETED